MLVFAGSISIKIGKNTVTRESSEPLFETEVRDIIVDYVAKNNTKVPVAGSIQSHLSNADFYVTRDDNNCLTVQLNKA